MFSLENVSPGLERPFIKIPIERDIKIHGPVEISFYLKNIPGTTIDSSADLIIERKNQGWFTLDQNYNVYRMRKRTTSENKIAKIKVQSPYLLLDLRAGDSLIVSLQRSDDAIRECSGKPLTWIINEEFPLTFKYLNRDL